MGNSSVKAAHEPHQPLVPELDPHRARGGDHVAVLVEERTGRLGRSTVAFDGPPDRNEPFTEEHVAVPVCREGAEKAEPTVQQGRCRIAGTVEGAPDCFGMYDTVGGVPFEWDERGGEHIAPVR